MSGSLFLYGGVFSVDLPWRWVSVSSCNLGISIDGGWWLWAPAMKNKGLQLVLHRAGMFYQHKVKSGWSSVFIYFGDSVPLQGDLSSDELSFLSVFEASDFLFLGDAMVNDHPLRPGRSAFIVHVGSDMLFKTATQNYVSSPGRRSASSSKLRPAAAKKTGRSLQGLECIFFSFEGVLVRNGL